MPLDAIKEWRRKSEQDRRAAMVLKAAEGLLSPSAYHLHQASEKLLKAVLVKHDVPPPRTHDLLGLVALLPEEAPPEVIEALETLMPFALITRYPGFEEVTAARYGTAEAAFELFQAWCDEQLVGYRVE